VTLVLSLVGLPYPVPIDGAPLRLAFVGQSTFFEACALHENSSRVVTRWLEFRSGAEASAMRASLDRFRPHAVVCFRPEIFPPGVLAGLPSATLGFITEPLPRRRFGRAHPDLRRRRRDLRQIDPGNFDRIVSFDPFIVPSADAVMHVWRSLPLPVADSIYAPVRRLERPPKLLFIGRSTPHREAVLIQTKHEFDLLHVAFGLGVEDLVPVLRAHDVAINVHNERYPSFENRVSLHLAAGHLVVSEALSPTHGLEPGIDYLEIADGGELVRLARELESYPHAHHRVRVRGRRKAEAFRASRVYPRLIADLWRDLAAFGTARTA
jgi:hypothetical protein